MLNTRKGMLATAMHGWRAVAEKQMSQRSVVAAMVLGRYLHGSFLGWLKVIRHERQLQEKLVRSLALRTGRASLAVRCLSINEPEGD